MDKFIVSALRLWNGKERLSLAFWGVFVPVLFLPMLVPVFNLSKIKPQSAIIVIVFIVLKVFSIVALWRCAPNAIHNAALKRDLARVFAALNALVLVMLVILPAILW